MSKALALALILVFLILIASCIVYIRPVEAQNHGYISINADGSIGPSSAPISKNGDTYTLTSDIKGTVSITKNNITFNGNGHTINQYAATQDSLYAFGIFLSNVYNVTVVNTRIINSGNGIYSIQNPTAGIYVDGGGSNFIVANNLVNNYNGLLLSETTHNIISQNNLTNSNNPYGVGCGILLWGASDNKIYRNNFIDNKSPAQVMNSAPQSLNSWDNGKEGNFWSDYTGTDANDDGIGDAPYEVYTRNRSGALFPKNTDNYPLIKPFNSTLPSLKTTLPKITVLSPLNEVYNQSSIALAFNASKAVNWTSYSFDGHQNITFSGNTSLTDISNGVHNITIYAQDTFGNFGSSQTINFTIAKPESSPPQDPFPTVPVAAASVIAVVLILVAGLLIYQKGKPNIEDT